MTTRRKIAIAMSGGVDSSVAAYLLKQQYPHDHIMALHMNNWNVQDEEEAPTTGCLEQDRKDAEAVCRHLSLPPLHSASFAAEYWTGVFEPFVEGIAQHNAMPNPDVGCNAIVKFGAMKDYAHKTLGADMIATGHYARLWDRLQLDANDSGEEHGLLLEDHDWLHTWGDKEDPLLLAGVDKTKDQSYFLAGVQGRSFRNVLFPLGDLNKSGTAAACSNTATTTTVRQLAEEAQLPNATKRDSMGICFVGKRDFGSFISQYLPALPPPGNFIDVETGAIVGQHGSSLHYTIGQGAKISGAAQKWFVVDHVNDCDVLVCAGTHHPALYSEDMRVHDMIWIGGEIPAPLRETGRLRLDCRTRHLQPLVSCEIRFTSDGGPYRIHFDQPIRAITPGQMAVFYIGDVCLGGGAIVERGPSHHERGLDLPSTLHPAGHNDLSVMKRLQQS
jgi:tRNA U34 2-thiouridine synthase MnmA/TrmU